MLIVVEKDYYVRYYGMVINTTALKKLIHFFSRIIDIYQHNKNSI